MSDKSTEALNEESTNTNSLRRRFGKEGETSNSDDDPKLSEAKMEIAKKQEEEKDDIKLVDPEDSFTIHDANIFIIFVAIFFRLLVGLHSYSGEGFAPIYGDFEAQRHWMEITFNTPLKDWYRNTGANDLNYWGLDYPPLSAYWAYITGFV